MAGGFKIFLPQYKGRYAMKIVVAVAIGGALGTMLRYMVQKAFNVSFPTGTFAVNLIGCFLAGVVWAGYVKGLNAPLYFFLMTGLCGGFTTFSAFSVESIQMALSGKWLLFLFYVLGSTLGGLLATFIGYKIFSA